MCQTSRPQHSRNTREESTCVSPDYNVEIQKLLGSEESASVPSGTVTLSSQRTRVLRSEYRKEREGGHLANRLQF